MREATLAERILALVAVTLLFLVALLPEIFVIWILFEIARLILVAA